MQIDAVLANHAEVVNNLLYLSGGGVELGLLPPGSPPPYRVNLGIGIMLTIPWDQTNHQHHVQIELLNEDGQPVQLPIGPETTNVLQMTMPFNVGRPPGLITGDDQHVSMAANLPALPLPATGKYIFAVRVDGKDERRLPYRIVHALGN